MLFRYFRVWLGCRVAWRDGVRAPIPERFRELGSLEFSKLVLEKALVAVSPGVGFGPLGEGHVRFALVENEHRTRQATRTIKQFLARSS